MKRPKYRFFVQDSPSAPAYSDLAGTTTRHRMAFSGKPSCPKVLIEKRNSQYKDHFASVCKVDGVWKYSGPASHGRTILRANSTAKGAIKAAVRTNRCGLERARRWTERGSAVVDSRGHPSV